MNVDDVNNWLKSKDEHIGNILDWIKALGDLNLKIIQTEQNADLEEEISQIIEKLVREVGMKVVSLLLES